MKTAKMALKIILALSLPLNVMASGNGQSASGRELSIETKLDIQGLKMDRDRLQKEVAKSTVAIQVLQDIADPGLLSFYRQNDVEIALAAALGGYVSGMAIAVAGQLKLGPNSVLVPAFKGSSVVMVGGLVVSMGEVLHQMIQGDDYRDFHSDFKNLSAQAQRQAFLDHKNRIVEGTVKVEQLIQKIEALEQ